MALCAERQVITWRGGGAGRVSNRALRLRRHPSYPLQVLCPGVRNASLWRAWF